MKLVATTAAAIALTGSVAGGVFALEQRYAKTESVSAVAQQIALLKISSAKASGNRALLQNYCADFERLYKWRPSECRN